MLKAALIGAGGMGKAWAKNLTANSNVDFFAWVDVRPGAAATASAELQLAPTLTDATLTEVLARPEIDFIIDVTIPEAHAEVTIQALEAGKPVLGEKPMATSMEEARAMVAASERSGKLYMVSQSRRYDGNAVAYRKLIEQIGRIGILNSDFYIGAHFGGFRDEMASPLLLDMAIHTFDTARQLTGSDPISVYAEEFNPSWSWYRGDACATALFKMSDGLRYNYRGSWCSDGCHTTWESDWRAVGSKGSATWDGASSIVADTVVAQGDFFRFYGAA